MNLKEMLERAKALLAEMDGMGGDMEKAKTEEEKTVLLTTFKAKEGEYDALEKDIERAKSMETRRASLAAAEAAAATVPAGDLAPAEGKDHAKEERSERQIFRDYVQGRPLSDQAKEHMRPRSAVLSQGKAADGVRVPRGLARKIFGAKVYNALFEDGGSILSGGMQYGLEPLGMDPDDERAKALPMTTAEGAAARTVGALINEEFKDRLLELPGEPPKLFERVTIVPTDSGLVRWPKLTQADGDDNEYGGVTVEWKTEGAEKPDTEPNFEQVRISTHELCGYTELTDTLIRTSAIGVEAIVDRLFRQAIRAAIENAIISGSGVNQPMGIINTTGIHMVPRAGVGAIDWTDFVDLEFALRDYHRGGAMYVLADGTLRLCKRSKDTTDRPIWTPSVANGIAAAINGYPYVGTHRLTLAGGSDAMFLDPREYILAVEQDIVVKMSEHYKFKENVKAFAAFAAVGGLDVQPRTVAVLGGSTS